MKWGIVSKATTIPTGWVDWSGLNGPDDDIPFVARLAALRRRFPQLRPKRWVKGRFTDGSFGALWLTPNASEMTEQDWHFPGGRFLAYLLSPLKREDEALYIVLNGALEMIDFTLPYYGCHLWTILLDTAFSKLIGEEFVTGARLFALPQSVLVFSGKA